MTDLLPKPMEDAHPYGGDFFIGKIIQSNVLVLIYALTFQDVILHLQVAIKRLSKLGSDIPGERQGKARHLRVFLKLLLRLLFLFI